jgi:serine/threonine-protein kinase
MTAVETSAPQRDPLDAAAREELQELFAVDALHRRGPVSLVYIARDLEDDQPVALKVMPRSPSAVAAAEDAFHRAAAAVAVLRHVHVVALHRSGATRRFFWYAMEYVEGPSLADVLREKGPMDLLPCLRVVEQVGSALDYAHRRGVVHANLKPANVLFDATGWARVTDFCVPRVLKRLGALSDPGGGDAWQAAYVAPEESSERQAGPHADQYALAVLVYQSLGGRLAAAEQPLASLPLLCDADLRVPRHVALAVRRALSATPGARFANVVDFVADLQAPATPMMAPAVPAWTARTARPRVLLLPPTEHAGISKRRWVSLGALSLAVAGAAAALALPGLVHPTKGTIPISQVPVATATPDSTSPRPDSTVGPSDTGWAGAAPRPSAVVPVDAPPAPTARPAQPVPSSAPPGRLFINATPWGRIYVDDVLVGNTPKGAIQVMPGTHRVRIMRDGYAPFERTIGVASGKDLRLTDIVLVELTP